MIDELSKRKFQSMIWAHYRQHGRHDLPWRHVEADGRYDAYKVMISEVMLQQTQVARVIPKYNDFIRTFPNVLALATAPQGEVLKAWSGLGYNRRAKFLHLAARDIIDQYDGTIPTTSLELVRLSGIGVNTASAIAAYAFNQPDIFIETNIRSVFIHHFFAQQANVTDQAIKELVSQTVDTKRPREWYWALMDYGAHLKRTGPNPNMQSRHYTKQSRFQGSRRQLRGQILRMLSDQPYSKSLLADIIEDERLSLVLRELLDENLIRRHGTQYCL